ncbi:hypothetical protein G6F57_001281 [Rhizopus arrhizus]|uniref:Phosphatidylglycerol/phosphatidylinositol transfer protein n=1 Tax=Rhizopus oryzae TaxID=64495 RepID=A0A9P6XIT1_RHIOR|nr:hypothetical protein G6F23_004854 [Rhizopus arrhizus]KAG1423455.1 hypothetical protein G6F58_002806 [Rhizopus delemar]KAG0769568.1 hypothetical protein G6F24_000959 [Rhizopus arrhizus]KAG0796380.1 hypothetical protein G6F21_001354 [Rhizopus arrhizus]KAG0817828.1 hypothetical protein G6F20_002058 [Rhizopus arrhizus]
MKHLIPVTQVGPLTSLSKPNVDIEFFDESESLFQHKSVDVDPNPLEPGDQVNVTIVGDLLETVDEGAYAEVVVKIGLVKILQKTFDICEELRKHKNEVDIQCPIEKGPFKLIQSIKLPKEIPRGKFTVLASAYTVAEESLANVKITADFRKGHHIVGETWYDY